MLGRSLNPQSSKFSAVTLAVFNQPVVGELTAVINIQRCQEEGQAHANTLECFDYEAIFSDDDRRVRPSARDQSKPSCGYSYRDTSPQ